MEKKPCPQKIKRTYHIIDGRAATTLSNPACMATLSGYCLISDKDIYIKEKHTYTFENQQINYTKPRKKTKNR